MRLSNQEWKLLGILIATIFIFSGLLYYDLNKKEKFGNRDIIGTITFKKNIVQRKFDRQVTWARLEKNSPLANRDTVLSSDFSDAVIRLNDGTEIQIDENTMLFLEVYGKETNLDFETGSIKIKRKDASGELKIKSKDTTIEVESGDVKLEKSKDKNLDLYVNEGKAKISDGKFSRSLNSEERAEFGKDGVLVSKIGLKLVFPENQKMEYQTNHPILFQWSKSKDFSATNFEISKRRNFSSIWKKIHIKDNSASIRIDEEGTYYWRVAGLNQKTNNVETSESRKIIILQKEELKLLLPRNGSVINFQAILPRINFHWKKLQNANGYKLQIAKNQNFTDSLRTFDVYSNSYGVENTKEGKYFWRVIVKSGVSGAEEKSTVSTFSVIQKTNLDTETHKSAKESSADEKEKKFTELKESTKNLNKVQEKEKSKTKNNSQTKENLSRNRNHSNDKEEDLENRSNNVQELKALYPVNSEVDLVKEKALKFKWTDLIEVESYSFKLFNANKGQNKLIYHKELNSNFISITDFSIVEEGEFYWTVTSKMKNKSKSKLVKSNFRIVAKSRLKNIKPSDIKLISPTTIYKEDKK
ncbi:MAG: FecR domain-containing protein [Leptospiraceae bacterium]|nr:FecR domain-containing protein [Leptospiraceae bacterium]MCK6380678.1 FecR domain-containing protein [Leptospiraceae bacterium]NUM42082.1 FecR domain-containing protein [Leptospiraceae bacterium]